MRSFCLAFLCSAMLKSCRPAPNYNQQAALADQCYEGSRVRRGNFWYVCRQGNMEPVSCVAPDGKTQFAVGTTYRTESFLLECARPEPYAIQMAPIACVNQDGHVISPGNLFTPDQNFYLRCTRVNNSLQTQVVGCVGRSGELVPNGGTVQRGQFVFKCNFFQNGIRLEAYACLYDNVQYSIGQDIVTLLLWYKCSSEPGGAISIKPVGCVKQGRKYLIGEKFDDGNFLFECVRGNNTVYPMGVGCVEMGPDNTKVQYLPGQKWLATLADYHRYLIECQKQDGWLKRTAVQCYYSLPHGQGYLSGGCARVVGNALMQCLSATGQSNPNVRLRITEPYDPQVHRNLLNGLRMC